MLAYNITLQLKSYTNEVKLDFKSTIRKLSTVQTTLNTINSAIKFETIPTVCENLQSLFLKMNIKFQLRFSMNRTFSAKNSIKLCITLIVTSRRIIYKLKFRADT